jgi:hypothetical protein
VVTSKKGLLISCRVRSDRKLFQRITKIMIFFLGSKKALRYEFSSG